MLNIFDVITRDFDIINYLNEIFFVNIPFSFESAPKSCSFEKSTNISFIRVPMFCHRTKQYFSLSIGRLQEDINISFEADAVQNQQQGRTKNLSNQIGISRNICGEWRG